MKTDKPSEHVLSISKVLETEFQLLHGRPLPSRDTTEGTEQIYREAVHGMRGQNGQAAICLSGGGVRSATFCLGVLQALAEKRWLDKFHYMSSVSGGGYIASWLSSWIARSKDLQHVLDKIAPSRNPPTPPSANSEPDQIRGLRAYSNYLSPVHGFSMDLLTLIATFIRNLSLHWLIILPLLAAIVVLPRLHLALILSLGPRDGSAWLHLIPIPVFLLWMAYTAVRIYTKRVKPESTFATFYFQPLVLVTIAESWALPFQIQRGEFSLAEFAVGGGVLALSCKTADSVRREIAGGGKIFQKLFAVAVAGTVTGILMFCVSHGFAKLLQPGQSALPHFISTGLYAVLFVPAALAAIWSGISLYVGLVRRFSLEDEREWWARACAWIFWLILSWIAFTATVIFGPYLLLQSMHTKQIGASAGVLGLISGAYGYWSKQGRRKVESVIAIAGERVLELAAGIFIVALLIVVSFVLAVLGDIAAKHASPAVLNTALSFAAADYASRTAEAPWSILAGIGGLLLAIGMIASRYFGTNTFSLHNMYGNRLVRAYLGTAREARAPDPFTGFDPADNISMSTIAEAMRTSPPPRLYHVINIALNMVKPTGKHLDWQQRKAASFTVTPHYAGSVCAGFQPSATYSDDKGISLARAMTISGAAASSNMGYHTSSLVAFVMTFFNVRLGWWLPNPGEAGKSYWNKSEPKLGSFSIAAESMAETTADSKFLYLTDGGHFENLGLYEMVRRRCHKIIVVDASCDPRYEFDDLENAIRKIRVDFGISIVFPDGLPTPSSVRDDKKQGKHSAHGIIRYSCVDGPDTDGELIYIKPILTGSEPLDITRYAAKSRKAQASPFPHHSTTDQFFDEIQFESYRALGYHSIMADFPDGESWQSGKVAPPPAAAEEAQAVAALKNKQADTDDEQETSAVAGVMESIRRASQSGVLWTAVTVSGAVGAVSTFALKDNSEVGLKKGAEISINAQDLATLKQLLDRPAPPRNEEPDRQIELFITAVDKLREILILHASSDQSIVVSMNNTLDKQVELIRKFEQTRNKEHITIIRDTLKTVQESLPKTPDYTKQLDKISGSLDGIDVSIRNGMPALRSELRKVNPRGNVSATQETRP